MHMKNNITKLLTGAYHTLGHVLVSSLYVNDVCVVYKLK
jgi:hypothetical protein